MTDPSQDTNIETSIQQFADKFFSTAEPDLQFTFGAATHAGRVRPGNEDHYAVLIRRRTIQTVLTSLAPDDLMPPDDCAYLMVVADGIGGMRAGELASRLTIQTVVELSGQATSWVSKLTDLAAQQMEHRIAAYVKRVHDVLQEQGSSDPATRDLGTTWTSAYLMGSRAVIVHLGDSRAYLYRDAQLQQITRDDTMAQLLIDAGVEREKAGEFGHVLTNSLGGGNENALARINEVQLKPGDQLLLCTDGLSDMVSDEAIAAGLQQNESPQAACDALLQQALENGGRDNVTLVLAYIAAPQAAAD